MTNLPEELLLNILLRLPVKSLLRFKTVSKRWRSLISDPCFANSYFQRSSSFRGRLLHISGSRVRSIDFNSSFYDDFGAVQRNSWITSHPRDLWIWGSCRGFVLLDDFHYFFLWNPSTGSYKRLSYFPMPIHFSPLLRGFGYDASNDDYVVVLSHSHFFSMKANSWKKIEDGINFPYSNNKYESSGFFLNGAIHWLVSRHDISVDVILAFNVTERAFHDIPLADNFYGHMKNSFLGTLGECLSFCLLQVDTADIWLMKEYGMKSSWTKSIVVSFADIPTRFFFPIGLTQNGEIVGSVDDDYTGLLKCNDKGEVLEYRKCRYEWGYKVVTYTETLFSLPCGSEEVRGEDRQQQ